MKKLLKWMGYSAVLSLIVALLFLANLFFMKPLSIDHFLAKELFLEMLDSPESLTYLGVVDRFNWFTGHQSEISINGLKELDEDLLSSKDARLTLLSYEEDSLSNQQQISRKIALFTTK